MAVENYKCKADRVDRIIYGTSNVRVRPGEIVEVDLAEPDQDDAFNQALYDLEPEDPPHHIPFSP